MGKAAFQRMVNQRFKLSATLTNSLVSGTLSAKQTLPSLMRCTTVQVISIEFHSKARFLTCGRNHKVLLFISNFSLTAFNTVVFILVRGNNL